MDNLTLAQKLLGKEKTTENKSQAVNPSSASIVYMIAVTSSSGGEVVLKDEVEATADWEEEDIVEVDEDGDFEEFELEDDSAVDDSVVDMTDGDGADIDEAGENAVLAYQADAVAAYAEETASEEGEVEEDDLAGEDAEITDEIDDGDATELPDVGEAEEDDLAGDDTAVDEIDDADYTLTDDNSDDESDDPIEGAEISDGYTVAECIGSIKEGDRVAVMIQDGKMTVLGVVGSGDEAEALQRQAQETAEEATAAADSAMQKAEAAEGLAGQATQDAADAKVQAEAASTAATNAQTEASTAKQEALEAAQKANEAKEKADLVETNLSAVTQEVNTVKEDATKMRTELEAQIETVTTTMSATYAKKTDVSQVETTLRSELQTSIAGIQSTFAQDYAKKTELEDAIVTAKASLQTQIKQNADSIALTAKSVEDIQVDITDQNGKITQAIQTANAAQSVADAAKTDATQAQTAANEAKTQATAANTAAANAQTEANEAKTKANAAQTLADEAKGNLAAAQAKLTELEENTSANAEDIAEAQKAVQDAEAAVQAAQTAADKAKADAQTAQKTADAAKTSASAANTAAANAQTKANEAKSAADVAQSAADEAKEDLKALENRVVNAETAISQNSYEINLRATKTEVAAVQTNLNNLVIGGRNLLKNTNVLYSRTNAETKTVAKSASFVDGYDLQQLIGKTVVFSYLQHTPGTRDSSLSTDTGTNKRFGMHGTVRWRDSTGAKADKTDYPFTQFLTATSTNKRVEATFTLTPPAGYDTILSFTFAIQMFSKPAADNTETWLLGYPKLEIGTKATDWTPAPEDQDAATQAVADNLAANYYTKTETTAEIKTVSDSITLTVNNVKTTAETAKNSIDALKVGGRNLLRNSKGDDCTDWIYKGTVTADDEKGSCIVKSITKTSEDFLAPPRTGKIEPSTQYTFSLDIYVDENVNSVDMFWLADTEESKKTGTSFVNATQFVTGLKPTVGKWERVTKTFTTKSNDYTGFIRIDNNGSKTAGTAAVLKVANLKLEKGNRATDWTPAPEDMATVRQLSAAEARLEIAESGISSQVSVTDGLTTRMSVVEQTAQGLTVNLQTTNNNVVAAQNTANAAQTAAANAQTTADTAKSNAATAQTTADTAKTNAATAQSTANSAKTIAEAAKKTLYHSAGGTSGTAGYVGICQLKVTGTYANRPIIFGLSDRGKVSSNVSFQFANKNNTDPELSHIQYDGAIEVWAYKTGTSTWVLIAKKSEAYDTIYVDDFTNNNSGVTVTWTNTMYTALPTSNITKGTLLAGKITKATVDNAAKTATNYLNFSSDGLVVGDLTAATLGNNVLINSYSVDIRNGTKVLASYQANTIYLGLDNAYETTIDFCNGMARFSTYDDSDEWNRLLVNSEYGMYFVTSGEIKHTCAYSPDAGQTEYYATVDIIAERPWGETGVHYPSILITASRTNAVTSTTLDDYYSTIEVQDNLIALQSYGEIQVPTQIRIDGESGTVLLQALQYEFYALATSDGARLILNQDEAIINTNLKVGGKGYNDGKGGVLVDSEGFIQIQRNHSSNHPYIGFYLNGSTTTSDGTIRVNQSTGYMEFLAADRYTFDNRVTMSDLLLVDDNIWLGADKDVTVTKSLSTYWKDGSGHNLCYRGSDGLTANFGWAGSSSYATVTKISGRTCQYVNSSGTTALSDERLKEGFESLDRWDAFFYALEPFAFKLKNGNSGRFHFGFKAQQFEQALLDNGLTAQDCAAFVRLVYQPDEDDPEGNAVFEEAGIKAGDYYYGIIYTELIAMNVYQTQQLKAEMKELKAEIQRMKNAS